MLYTARTEREASLQAPNLAIFEPDRQLPVSQLNDDPFPSQTAYRLIKDELMDEGNSRQNLATFCQTWMEPEATRLMAESLAINAIDKSEYPKMTEIENRCVDIIAGLWGGEPGVAMGTSTVGSSEACMLGGLALKFRWRKMAEAAGIDTKAKKCNLVISTGYQVCWEKFCRYWDVDMHLVPLDEKHPSLNLDTVLDYVDDYTIGIVGIMGITYTGKFDDIKKLDALVEKYNKTAKVPLGIHVDGASGGFYVPFTDPKLEWDFRLKNVVSINSSGHKYGLVYPGIGWVLWKDKSYLPDDLIFYVNYLGGEEPTMAINFSRSGSQIVGQYYIFTRYGHKGLQLVQQGTGRIAEYIAQGVADTGLFEFVNKGDNIPIVCYKLKNPDAHHWTLYELADRLAMKGWQVPAYTLPKDLEKVLVQRFVFRADFSMPMAHALLDDFRFALDYLEKNTTVDTPGKTKSGAQGFTH